MDPEVTNLPQFRVLGPLEIADHGRPLALHGLKQRAALGFLLLHANQVVASSELLRALWPDGGPPTARKIMQNAVSGLRATLRGAEVHADAARLLSRPPGYLLRVRPEALDLGRFHLLAEAGRAALRSGADQRAAVLLREALDLWRGSVLEDLVECGIRWPQLSIIENARLTVQEDYFEAALASGRHREVIGELQAATDLDPMRERMRGLLILALYRGGQQVAALENYRRHRVGLNQKLGLEPGQELRGLERAILNQDPSLSLGAPAPGTPRRPSALRRESAGPDRSTRSEPGEPRPIRALPDHAPEMWVLDSLLALTRRRHRPHLVTVLGEPGTGKTRLVATFRSNLRRAEEGAIRCVVGRTPTDGSSGLPAVIQIATSLHTGLRPARDNIPLGGDGVADLLETARRRATERPLVMVLEDLDGADDAALEFVDTMDTALGQIPVLIIVTARPGLLVRRPDWGGGSYRATIALNTLDAPGIRKESFLMAGYRGRHVGDLSPPAPAALAAADAPGVARSGAGRPARRQHPHDP